MEDSRDMMESPQNNIELSYKEFVANIEIEKVYVKRLNMEGFIAPSDVINYLAGDKKVEINVNHEFKLLTKEEKDSFYALGVIQAIAKVEEDVIFLVEVELVAQYDISSIKKKIAEEIYEQFVDHNVPVNLWPYAREIIQNATTRMDYPPLVIRPYKVLF